MKLRLVEDDPAARPVGESRAEREPDPPAELGRRAGMAKPWPRHRVEHAEQDLADDVTRQRLEVGIRGLLLCRIGHPRGASQRDRPASRAGEMSNLRRPPMRYVS